MALHKDLTGSDLHDPAPHDSSHEDGGTDEINVDGLSGTLTDKQHPKFTGTDAAMSVLPSAIQILYSIEMRLNSIENKISLLGAEAKRANTNFDLNDII